MIPPDIIGGGGASLSQERQSAQASCPAILPHSMSRKSSAAVKAGLPEYPQGGLFPAGTNGNHLATTCSFFGHGLHRCTRMMGCVVLALGIVIGTADEWPRTSRGGINADAAHAGGTPENLFVHSRVSYDALGPTRPAGGMRMKSVFCVLLLSVSVAMAADNEPAWSPAVNGLRARLFIMPPEKADSPFCRVLVEMENVDDVAGQKKIRFTPDKLALRVTDETGKNLPIANGSYDGTAPLWEPTLLPYRGIIKFQISFPGLGYNPTKDKVIIDAGPSRAWIIPQNGSAYLLSGSLTVQREPEDHPHMVWSGTLELPKVRIPKAR